MAGFYPQIWPKTLKNYGPEDGFIALQCIQNAIVVDAKGDVWFGTTAGAYRYPAREDSGHSIAPLTSITNLRISYENVDWREFGADTLWHRPEDWSFLMIGIISRSISLD